MSAEVTIIMYHFVRDLEQSRYPRIKGLRLVEFKEQLEYIITNYSVLRMDELIAATADDRHVLPANAALLTFDDGYADHFSNVFPLLDEKGVQGSFFPPARAILERTVLDVNKIHFVLAAVDDKTKIIQMIYSQLESLRIEYNLQSREYYLQKVPTTSRFDTPEVTFIKAMLQRELPENARRRIVDRLFTKYVTGDEKAFANELYMSVDQIRCLRRNGMFVGCHGYDHHWLGTLDPQSQEKEIALSLSFLDDLGCDLNNWVMCYPYGSYNESLLRILKQKNCRLGLTVQVGLARLGVDDVLCLPRMDTNDLPKNCNAMKTKGSGNGLT